MGRTTVDRTCFAVAVLLLGYGTLAWWADGPAPGADASSWSMLAIWGSVLAILVGWWRWDVAGPSTQWAIAPLTLAVSASLSMVPLVVDPGPSSIAGLVVTVMAVLPLGVRIADVAGSSGARRQATVAVALMVTVGILLSVVVGAAEGGRILRIVRWAAASGVAAIPAAIVAWERIRGLPGSPIAQQRRSLDAMVVVTAGLLPALAAIVVSTPVWPTYLVPIAAAGLTALLIVRLAVIPLARIAASASGQRDRVVAAAEAERERLAFALHDGALAEVTLLIQRLDQQGDCPSATIARGIADELRGLGSELRLPILDDLGTGPALEWLAGRLAQRSGVTVALHQSTTSRPPAPVELATYRVAQEAIVNALKHGAAPISVDYVARPGEVVLCVDDAGPGIDRDAPMRAEREGRLGILSMTQRAEAIGARLVLATRPDGGTRVRLEWHPS